MRHCWFSASAYNSTFYNATLNINILFKMGTKIIEKSNKLPQCLNNIHHDKHVIRWFTYSCFSFTKICKF